MNKLDTWADDPELDAEGPAGNVSLSRLGDYIDINVVDEFGEASGGVHLVDVPRLIKILETLSAEES